MYKKIMETKIIRTKHIVSFSVGTLVDTLIHELTNVPSGSRITEIDDESITFIEEKEEG